jgi:pyruvate kinase
MSQGKLSYISDLSLFIRHIAITSSETFYYEMIRRYLYQVQSGCVVYFGDEVKNIKNLAKMKIRAPIIVLSEELSFLNYSRLFYSVQTILLEEGIINGYGKNYE